MTPDKAGWWSLRTLWCGDDDNYPRDFIVEVEERAGQLVYWFPHLDYAEPVSTFRGEWLGPAILFDDAKWGELLRLRDEARQAAEDCFLAITAKPLLERAYAYETAARLLGRELPPWQPEAESMQMQALAVEIIYHELNCATADSFGEQRCADYHEQKARELNQLADLFGGAPELPEAPND